MALPKILVLCTGNSCRSQMAEGYLRQYLGNRAEIYSAGVETHGLNSRAVRVMAEDQVDISGHESTLVDTYQGQNIDTVITVCDHAQEVCPVFPGATKTIHHSFSDPAQATGTEEEIMAAFRQTRNDIRNWTKNFAKEYFEG